MGAGAGKFAQGGLGFFMTNQGWGSGHVTTPIDTPVTLAAPAEPGCQRRRVVGFFDEPLHRRDVKLDAVVL